MLLPTFYLFSGNLVQFQSSMTIILRINSGHSKTNHRRVFSRLLAWKVVQNKNWLWTMGVARSPAHIIHLLKKQFWTTSWFGLYSRTGHWKFQLRIEREIDDFDRLHQLWFCCQHTAGVFPISFQWLILAISTYVIVWGVGTLNLMDVCFPRKCRIFHAVSPSPISHCLKDDHCLYLPARFRNEWICHMRWS